MGMGGKELGEKIRGAVQGRVQRGRVLSGALASRAGEQATEEETEGARRVLSSSGQLTGTGSARGRTIGRGGQTRGLGSVRRGNATLGRFRRRGY